MDAKKVDVTKLKLPPSPLSRSQLKELPAARVQVSEDIPIDNAAGPGIKKSYKKNDKSKKKKSPPKEFPCEEISTTVGPTTSSPQTSSSEEEVSPKVKAAPERTRSRERSSTISSGTIQPSNYKFNPFSDKPSYCFLTPREVSPITSPMFTHNRNAGTLTRNNTVISITGPNSPRAHSLRTKTHNRPGIPDFMARGNTEADLGNGDDLYRRARSNSNSSGIKPKPSGCFVTLEAPNSIAFTNSAQHTTENNVPVNRRTLKLNLSSVTAGNETSSQGKADSENGLKKSSSKASAVQPSLSMLIAGTSPSTSSTLGGSGAALSSSSPRKIGSSGEKISKKKKKSKKSKRDDDDEEEVDKDAAEWEMLMTTLGAKADPMKHVKIWGKALFRVDPPFSAAKLPKDGRPFAKTICRVIFKKKKLFSSSGKTVDMGSIERMEQDGSFVELIDLGQGVTKVMQSWDPTNSRFALVVCTETSSIIIETLPQETSKDWFGIVERVHKKIVRQKE